MSTKSLKKGVFITFEGVEGCGKSTQARLIYDHLSKLSYDCVITREPGGTKAGELIRDVLLRSRGVEISDLTELFLFEASRSQIVEELIRPCLAKKKIVICDRFNDATFSYQGYGGKVPMKTIKTLDTAATGGLKPDLTILLDVDAVTGLGRARKKGVDRMEKKDIAYHKRVRNGYLKLAGQDPARMKIISVTSTIDGTQELVRREVGRVIQRHTRAG
ncbi:MAG: dTMP kinase [Candidatus Omnitrophica bacterium]|nr:dTMP kinase [Candidatus Omnitrophota bacterium]